MTDKAPAAPISLRRVKELAAAHRRKGCFSHNELDDTAAALEALVRLVDALEEIAGPWPETIPAESIYQCQEIARATLAQFVDDRGHDADHREKKP